MKPRLTKENIEQLKKAKVLRKSKGPLMGVCGGLADYSGIDPIIIRILAVIALFSSFGTIVFVYLALGIFLPKPNRQHRKRHGKDIPNAALKDFTTITCPRCQESNDKTRNYCLECGEALY